MATGITLSGWNEFEGKIKNLVPGAARVVTAYAKDAGLQWAQLAKRAAPKDQGAIIRQISSFVVSADLMKTGVTVDTVSPAAHSRFVEWGTKKRKQVPPELASYEASLSYKKTGDYYDFLNAILDWVKRKGISDVTNSYTGKKVGGKAAKENLVVLAEAIAFSIIRHGTRPHPFFFIHKPAIEKALMERIQTYLNKPQ